MNKSADEKRKEAIEKRQEKQKREVLKVLETHPIVTGACKKVGISTSTYYRWRVEDSRFANLSDDALETGIMHINDIAGSQLIKKIYKGDRSSVFYWLNKMSPPFAKNPVRIGDPRVLYKKDRKFAEKLVDMMPGFLQRKPKDKDNEK